MEELTRAFHEISTRAYQQAGAQYQQREGPKEGRQGAADAEYKVVDEEE
jgi:hypothetical protein